MDDLFTKPVPLPKPKKYFNQKLSRLTRPRKLRDSLVNVYVEIYGEAQRKRIGEEETIYRNSLYDWLTNSIPELIKTVVSVKKGL